MKSKKFISGLLAGAMVLTSLTTFGVSEVKAAEDDSLVAYYTFENSLDNVQGEDAATAIVTGLGEYTDGEIVYDADGFKDTAIRLGDYGLKLNRENLGENFTVSMWLKADDVFTENQVLMFLGHHNPEKWIAVSGGRP